MVAYTSGSAPLSSLAMIIAPAIAAGNTVTLLPHTSNCLSALLVAHICTAAGLVLYIFLEQHFKLFTIFSSMIFFEIFRVPPGVINVVPQDHSDEMPCPVVHDNRVRKLAVVGSPSLGRSILSNTGDVQQNPLMRK